MAAVALQTGVRWGVLKPSSVKRWIITVACTRPPPSSSKRSPVRMIIHSASASVGHKAHSPCQCAFAMACSHDPLITPVFAIASIAELLAVF
jgi:hypothetical protein